MTFDTLTLTKAQPEIAIIELNRPDSLNAITFEMVAELHDALDQVAADTTCKVIVLTGAGRAFCAGLDLRNWGKAPDPGTHPHAPAGVDPQTFISNLTLHMRNSPQVIIAAVNGPAFGGGLALACAADIRIASDTATFCSAFIRTGLSGTDIGITYLLPKLIGNARAFDLVLSGRTIDATTAEHYGLVTDIIAGGELADHALQRAQQLASYTASGLRSTKEVLWHNTEAPSLQHALALEIRNQNLLQYAPDVQEYMKNYRTHITG